MVATDGGEGGGVGEALGFFVRIFAFSTAQALRAFSVRAAAAHSARRADEDFRCLAFGLETDRTTDTDKPVAGHESRAPAKPASNRHAMIAATVAAASLLADVMLVLHRTITRSFEVEVPGLDSCQPGTSTCVGLPRSQAALVRSMDAPPHTARSRIEPRGRDPNDKRSKWRAASLPQPV